MKKTVSIILLLAFMLAVPALAADTSVPEEPAGPATTGITISLRVEGISENLAYWKTATMPPSDEPVTVADVVRQFIGEGQYVETEGAYGAYFSSIFGEEEGMGTYGGWNYAVNGESPSVNMGDYVLSGGEEVVLYYGDINTLYPIISLDDGLLTVTAKSWKEGENGEWAEVEEPVRDVTVYWAGEEVGQTDSEGQLALPQSQPGRYTLQIRKDGEAISDSPNARRLPQVVRLASDYVVVVDQAPIFSDLPRDHRAYDAVMALYREQIINGKEDHYFGTDEVLTQAEAAALLYRLAGSPVVTEASGQNLNPAAWYYDAAKWAFSLNIFQKEGAFNPEAAVTGGELAGYIATYCGSPVELPREIGVYDTITRADAAILLADLL